MDGNLIAVTAFILAGGKSTRMGTDKAFMTLNGRSLLERMLDLGQSVTPDVRIIGNAQKFAPFAPTVEDVFRDCGPLGGIHAALRASSSELNLILAVDLPFVSPALLQYLITRAQSVPAASATVPDAAGGWQPLCAVYRREFADAAESALRAGRYKIDELFDVVQTQRIEEGELASAGLSPELFQNLNTREEVKAATEKLEVPSESQLSDDSRPQHPYVEFRDVSKAFGDNVVLNHVSFDVLPSETVCVLGRSGVGKSVALHHIMGFLKPDSGRVLVAGEDITDYTEEQLEAIRKKVTMVFHVQEMRDLLPSDLSTGMRRSVAIARALAARPECVLYDEPTTMVDPLMAQLLGDLIKRLKIQLNLTSIVVTHDMRLAKKLADRIVFLHEGKAIFFGTYAEMEKAPEPIIHEFLELDELKLEA